MLEEKIDDSLPAQDTVIKKTLASRLSGFFKRHPKKLLFSAGLVIFAHYACGFTLNNAKHELNVAYTRSFLSDVERAQYTFEDYDGQQNTITIIGKDHKQLKEKIEPVILTLPHNVVKGIQRIIIDDHGDLSTRNCSGDAHPFYNSGTMCLRPDASIDTFVHECYHFAWFETGLWAQYKFSQIGSDTYRSKFIPLFENVDLWERGDHLPLGDEGAAHGHTSHYSGKHFSECGAEQGWAIWKFAYPDMGIQVTSSSDNKPDLAIQAKVHPYNIIFLHPEGHALEDHQARYDQFVAHGLLSDVMIEKMEKGFAYAKRYESSTDKDPVVVNFAHISTH